MNPYEAFNLHRALLSHITTSYDYHKYNGKVKFVHPDKFKARKDFYFYVKLAKQKNVFQYCLANMITGKTWVGDIVTADGQKIYKDWQKRQQSLSYIFKEELDKIPNLIESLKVKDSQQPEILKMYFRRLISLETLVILLDLLDLIPTWDSRIDDPLWGGLSFTIKKYLTFFEYDKEKMKTIILQKLEVQ